MADITLSTGSGRRQKSLPRVDLTPMVDLGFILITFFIYTTTLLESEGMDMQIPVPSHNRQEIPMESTITLLLTNHHQISWYSGIAEDAEDLQLISITEIRQLVQQKQSEAARLPASFSKEAHQLHVVIKPDVGSKYNDLVTVLDEMSINDVPYYVLQDLNPDEQRWLQHMGD